MYRIKVYFEVIGCHSELVAIFNSEETYNACLPALEDMAAERGMEVTDNVCEEGSMEAVGRLLKSATFPDSQKAGGYDQRRADGRKSSLGNVYCGTKG